MSPAPASTAERQASKAALFTPAVAAHRPAGVQQPVDKMELSVEERKRLKREKRAQRHGEPAAAFSSYVCGMHAAVCMLI